MGSLKDQGEEEIIIKENKKRVFSVKMSERIRNILLVRRTKVERILGESVQTYMNGEFFFFTHK